MGRKPNPLFVEFFSRGSRVQDSSNRYEYYCKACNAYFPRGRKEYLTNHIFSSCTCLSDLDRERAVALAADGNSHTADTTFVDGFHQDSSDFLSDHQRDSSVDMSALETLAEVSRQQLGSRESGNLRQRGHDKRRRVDTAPSRDAVQSVLYDDQVERNLLDGLKPDMLAQMTPESVGLSAQDMASAASRALGPRLGPRPNTLSSSPDNSHSSNTPDHDTPPESVMGGSGNEGQNMPLRHAPSHNTGSILRTYPANPSIPSAGYLTDFRLPTSTTSGAPRSRFTSERREEVRTIRKLGACLRCRMLKKPCSPGDPCETCSKVETARLWKRACVRTKLAEEVDLFDSGLHQALSQKHLAGALHEKLQEKANGLTVRLHDGNDAPSMALPSIKLYTPGSRPPPDFFVDDPVEQPVEVVDANPATIRETVNIYIQSSCRIAIGDEQDPWIRASLRIALTMTQQRYVKLLKSVLCLWSATNLLASKTASTSARLAIVTDSDSGAERAPESLALIALQINAVLEGLASSYARKVASELEQRLQQRQKGTDTRFETLLASTILFNSLEKLASCFVDGSGPSPRPDSTVDQYPGDLANRCDSVTDLVTMLLKVRAVPFATKCDASGNIVRDTKDVSIMSASSPHAALAGLNSLLDTQCKEPAWMLNTKLVENFVTLWIDAAGLRSSPASNGHPAHGTPEVSASADVGATGHAMDRRFVSKLIAPA